MILDYIKRFALIIFILWSVTLQASPVDISKNEQISFLEQSSVYIDKKDLNIQEVIKEDSFQTYPSPYINIGTSKKTVWIKLELRNPTQQAVEKLLILTSSLLEHIALYKEGEFNSPVIKGVSNINTVHTTLLPYFTILLEANTSQTYYLKVNSFYEPVDFGLKLQDKNTYLAQDRVEQFVNIMLIGMVIALMLYSFLVSFYTKDKSYSFYSFYLFFLVYQQLTYLGLTQIYFPPYFVRIDIAIPIVKINLLIITSALFAMYFLKIQRRPLLHMGYKFFIYISLLEMIVPSLPGLYNLDIVILTGALFIVFNLFAGIFTYLVGDKQARLFIVGFGIVFASYVLMILDALGITSIMQDFRNLLMFSTAFEALILTLAFADRFIILKEEKEKLDEHLLTETKNRATIIKTEVIEKTKELNHALDGKELLIKDVHHRVKNNLQIILSMIRLQNDDIEDEDISKKFIDLENRINAISKTYDMLLLKDDLKEIDMQEYIDSLLEDLHNTLQTQTQEICIRTDIDVMIPLHESVYIGLIVNELVTNAYKYAFDNDIGSIYISLHQDKEVYILTVEDNGKGFIIDKNRKTLGLKLIHTLVYDQLNGEMEVHTNSQTKYTIRFSI
ncbi:MAG TPA: hypothetical protein EYH42_05095 [Sulfurovum sp.]|nr:hypothetical protein [Sulfurovum sp.]